MASELKVNVIVNASGDNDSGIDLATNDQVLIKTADTTAITVDASQRVGIGTTTPASNCEIESTGDTTLRITAGGTSNDSKIDFVHGTTVDGGITFDHNGHPNGWPPLALKLWSSFVFLLEIQSGTEIGSTHPQRNSNSI